MRAEVLRVFEATNNLHINPLLSLLIREAVVAQ